MPWLWMSVFGSILKFGHLTQTDCFGKELSLFLSLSLNINIALWLEGGAAMGPFCGHSEDEGHGVPRSVLRGCRRKVETFLGFSFFHVK